MTLGSSAFDNELYDGNTILLKINEENDRHRYVYIGGDMVCCFLTKDDIRQCISNMGINFTPYSIVYNR